MSARRGVLRAERGGGHWTFRVDAGSGPAFARIGPWRVTHLEAAAAGGEWLRALQAHLSAVEGTTEDEVTAALLDALGHAGANAISMRWHDADYPWPRWPEELRIGFPPAGQLWPADVELLGLRLGTRRVAKRDHLTGASREARVASWRRAGLFVAEVGGAVLASPSERELRHAVDAQTTLDAGRDEDGASRYFGDALGYPPCCVSAYLALAARDDAAMIDARLGGGRASPPELGFLIGPLSLISHMPCTLRCEASLALAQRILLAMDALSPGFAQRWRRVAEGVWGLDGSGRAWVFAGDESVREARLLERGLREMPAFRGEALTADGPSSLPLTFRSDHRMKLP